MQLKVGQTLSSAVDATSLVVVRAPATEVTVTVGGVPVTAPGEAPAAGVSAEGEPGNGALLGKRYADEALGLEVLCVKPGEYALAVDGNPLGQKSAQPLPASD